MTAMKSEIRLSAIFTLLDISLLIANCINIAQSARIKTFHPHPLFWRLYELGSIIADPFSTTPQITVQERPAEHPSAWAAQSARVKYVFLS